jgi:hypothetical protein
MKDSWEKSTSTSLPPSPVPHRPRHLKESLHSIDEAADFHDPYSDLNLFLSQKIRHEMKGAGFVKKWSIYLQEKLIEKISPEFQKKFPRYRLGVSAVRKTWEKVVYYSSQVENQKEAMTEEGKLNINFLIKENLKSYLQHKTSHELHPYHWAHHIAMKISECLATIDGIRPMLDYLTRMIWAVQRHMLASSTFQSAKSPYDEFDKFDRLIVKTILDITGKHPLIEHKELEARTAEAIQSLHELPSFASFDRITANVSALLSEKLYPYSCFHSLYYGEQKNAIFQFIRRHITLCKKSTFDIQLSDVVRRTMALYTLATSLPKNLNLTDIQNILSGERPDLPQAAYAFISAELLLLEKADAEAIFNVYQETTLLPSMNSDLLEMIVWKVLGQEEGLLEHLPYRIGQRIEEEIAHILIDDPHQSFNSVVHNAVQFFKKAKELATSKKSNEVARKIHIWTIQGDLLCRWIRLDDDTPLLQLLRSQYSESRPMENHTSFVSEVAQAYLRKYPNLAPYAPQVTSRIAILYKYAWYTLFSKPDESSLDRFLQWHIQYLGNLEEEALLLQLEEICKKTLPLLPFDKAHCRGLLLAQQKKEAENYKRHA